MFCRHYDIVRAAPSDAVRRWAELEGKSATTRDDLYRAQFTSAPPLRIKAAMIVAAAEVLAGALHIWWLTP
jgi:hypothetical protein